MFKVLDLLGHLLNFNQKWIKNNSKIVVVKINLNNKQVLKNQI